MIRPESQNFKIWHDGILSIGNFILMIKNHILLFQLPGNWPTTKKCAPYCATWNFLFIWFYFCLYICRLPPPLIFVSTNHNNFGLQYEPLVIINFHMVPWQCGSVVVLHPRGRVRDRHSTETFYLPHMEYEGSIGFVMRKMKNFYGWFSRFRTFYG
jgi:hypothetical protein